ncbi:MAG TPA: efflux RND transporter periplasmic adaptor subunit, partial [Cytophagaceae bacterium]|nr:efflux RND transporter periplasmic adaptor subunit [Cytophagaceae bacterium]
MNINIIVAVIVFFAVAGCHSKPETKEENSEDTNLNFLSLSAEQVKMTGIQTAEAEKRNIGRVIRANGILDVPPQSLYTISAPMGGFVKFTRILQGMLVKKGQLIVQLEHQDYIQLQQDYLDSKIQLEFVTKDYEREKELIQNNVSSVRNLQEISSRYKSLQNKVDAFGNKLGIIGINAKDLKEGNIQRDIQIVSPIDGYVTKIN